MTKKLPKSLRKYIRQEKARIRREVLDLKEQEKQIQELYQKLHAKSARSAKASRNACPVVNAKRSTTEANAPMRIIKNEN